MTNIMHYRLNDGFETVKYFYFYVFMKEQIPTIVDFGMNTNPWEINSK